MGEISLVDAKARLSEFVDRVEAGDSIDIARRGKAVAGLASAARPRKRIDKALLQAVTRSQPPQAESSADLVRRVRDANRF